MKLTIRWNHEFHKYGTNKGCYMRHKFSLCSKAKTVWEQNECHLSISRRFQWPRSLITFHGCTPTSPKAKHPLPKPKVHDAMLENKIFEGQGGGKKNFWKWKNQLKFIFKSFWLDGLYQENIESELGTEGKQGPLTADRLQTHFPQYTFGLYSPHKLSNFNHYPHWVWGEIDKENNIADNHKWIEFEHNWDELQCLKIELFQKWA